VQRSMWMITSLIMAVVALGSPALAQPPPTGNPPPPSFSAATPVWGPGAAPPPPGAGYRGEPGMGGPAPGTQMGGGYAPMPSPRPPGGRRRGGPEGLIAVALLLIALEGLVITYVACRLLRLAGGHCAEPRGEAGSPPPAG
jgi:hypothetical protein